MNAIRGPEYRVSDLEAILRKVIDAAEPYTRWPSQQPSVGSEEYVDQQVTLRAVLQAARQYLPVLVLLLLSASCAQSTPTAPSATIPAQLAATADVPAPPPLTPVIIPVPVPVASLDPLPAPTPTGRPFTRSDCDYSNLSAIRCYNPSAETLVLSAAVGPLNNCASNYRGVHRNVIIPPLTNGYFTLPQVACGETWQLDLWRGATTGSCTSPDFTAERTYTGPACPPPPPPPPPPPVCVSKPITTWDILYTGIVQGCTVTRYREVITDSCTGAKTTLPEIRTTTVCGG